MLLVLPACWAPTWPRQKDTENPGPGWGGAATAAAVPLAVSCARSGAVAPQPLAVVGVEDALVGTEPHGPVRVQQQPGETGGEVLHEALGDGAQGQPDISRQLVVVVLLQERG